MINGNVTVVDLDMLAYAETVGKGVHQRRLPDSYGYMDALLLEPGSYSLPHLPDGMITVIGDRRFTIDYDGAGHLGDPATPSDGTIKMHFAARTLLLRELSSEPPDLSLSYPTMIDDHSS